MDEQVKEVVETTYEYLIKYENGIQKAFENIRNDELSQIFELMLGLVDGMQWLVEALSAIKSNTSLEIDLGSVNSFLDEMNSAIENQDFVFLGDLLEYEMLPTVVNWKEKLETIAK